MPTHLDPLRIRAALGRTTWSHPEPFGPDGWQYHSLSDRASVIATVSDGHGPPGQGQRVWWVHASLARVDRMPDYDDLVNLHRAVFRGEWAYQVFAPADRHVNIHEHALHLWGRLDGKPALPDFTGDFPGFLTI